VTKSLRNLGLVSAALAMTLAAAACGSDNPSTPGGAESGAPQLSGAVSADGSSTVEPLTSAVATLYADGQPNVQVAVGTSGTGAGFEKFCNGETDISNASRAIEDDEAAACASKNIEFTELLVANDALTVAVHPSNDWATCLTVDELKKIWDAGSTVTNWNQVRAGFPDKPLGQNQLFGPGVDSGTFDYFTAEINGEEQQSRTNYTASEDDNVLVNGVAGEPNALGYFGYSHFISNQSKLKALQVDGGAGCVAPSPETVADGTYKPLARPLYIYVNNAAKSKPQVVDFVDFYVTNLTEATEEAEFVGLTPEQKTALDTAAAAIIG
jgi:phosphate transport system substrate-binding protein